VRVTGIVLCLYDAGTRLSQEVVRDLEEYLEKSRGTAAPWAKARIFSTRIRRNVKLAECPGFGQSIFQYAPKCPGAEDHAALAREVLGIRRRCSRPASPSMRRARRGCWRVMRRRCGPDGAAE